MTAVDEEVTRLWGLLTELSAQLSANREHCDSLKRQCEQLKTQAVHTGTGFTLRRFNTDITTEQFESELERFNATLVLENQALQYENRQLSMLLKDYEGTLDNVMAKFRGFAASTTQHELSQTRHYEEMLLDYTGSSAIPPVPPFNGAATQLLALQNGPRSSGVHPQDPMAMHLSLAHLGTLLRKALRNLQGEDVDDDSSSSDEEDGEDEAMPSDEEKETAGYLVDQLSHGSGKREDGLGVKVGRNVRQGSIAPSTGSKVSSTGRSSSERTRRRYRADSKIDLNEGGYLKILSEGLELERSERALERDTELVRLEKENRELRELLGIQGSLPDENLTSPKLSGS